MFRKGYFAEMSERLRGLGVPEDEVDPIVEASRFGAKRQLKDLVAHRENHGISGEGEKLQNFLKEIYGVISSNPFSRGVYQELSGIEEDFIGV